jgi:hypothetical protein
VSEHRCEMCRDDGDPCSWCGHAEIGGDVAESNAPVAPEVQESRPDVPADIREDIHSRDEPVALEIQNYRDRIDAFVKGRHST